MDQDLLSESFSKLLRDVADIAVVRAVHRGESAEALWETLGESGFLDALVAEAQGGVGLSRAEVAPLFLLAGASLLPPAFAHTVIARMLMAQAGVTPPVPGPVLLWPLSPAGALRSSTPPAAFEGEHALVQHGDLFRLMPLRASEAADGFGFRVATLTHDTPALAEFRLDGCDLFDWAAAATAASSAGAIGRVLELSRQHVTERQQFGRPLGNFQAIQHMIAQAAEQAVLASTAARIGLAGVGVSVDPFRVALAKTLTADAAGKVSRIAHAVHGAIGISEEHDLQLYTRSLKRWQIAYGTSDYWAESIGAARIAAHEGTAVDFIRSHLAPSDVSRSLA